MKTQTNQNKAEEIDSTERQKRINAQKRIASHLERAAKHYYDAAKYNENNNFGGAATSARIAHEHLTQANEIEKQEEIKDKLSDKIDSVKDALYKEK